jgi:hypothetical protein
VGVVWAAASVIPFAGIATYAAGKIQMRDRYAGVVPDLLGQLQAQVPLPTAALLAVGIPLAAWSAWRSSDRSGPGSRAPSSRARTAILAGWLVLPVALTVITNAGTDNFPLFFLALAVVAARPGRWFAGASMLTWAGLLALRVGDDLRVPTNTVADQVSTVLARACTKGEVCVIVSEQGLYHPMSDDPGRLGTFLAGRDLVTIVPLNKARTLTRAPNALVTWDCGDGNARLLQRFLQDLGEAEVPTAKTPRDGRGRPPSGRRGAGRRKAMAPAIGLQGPEQHRKPVRGLA